MLTENDGEARPGTDLTFLLSKRSKFVNVAGAKDPIGDAGTADCIR